MGGTAGLVGWADKNRVATARRPNCRGDRGEVAPGAQTVHVRAALAVPESTSTIAVMQLWRGNHELRRPRDDR
jgi:hypothetical protein